jgi:outer membrane protein assembly factor BamB
VLVPSFTVPVILTLLILLTCVGIPLAILWLIRVRRMPEDRFVYINMRALTVIIVVLLPCFLCSSFATFSYVRCIQGFYTNTTAPLPSSDLVALFSPNTYSVATFHANDGSSAWHTPFSPLVVTLPPDYLSTFDFSPVFTLSNHTLYLTDNYYAVAAYQANNGKRLWQTQLLPSNQPSSYSLKQPPILSDNMLYVPTITSDNSSDRVETIYALHPTTGFITWHLSFQLQQLKTLHFSAGANLLFISLGDTKISAYHASNGTLAWSTYNDLYRINYSPFSFDLSFIQQTLYFFRNNPSTIPNNASIVALNPTNGSLVWSHKLETSNSSNGPIQLSRSGSRLYLHSNTILYALDAANGNTLWQTTIGFSADAPTIEANDIVYVTAESSIYALNARNGSQLWQHTFGGDFDSLLLFHNVLFASSAYGYPYAYRNRPLCPGSNEPINTLFALNPSNGSIYWRQPNLYGHIALYSSP